MFIINIREILPYTLINASDIILSSDNTTGLLKEFVDNELIDTSRGIIETDYGFGVYFKKKEAAKYLNQRASKRDYYNIFQCEVCKKWYFNDTRNMKKKILAFDSNKAWFPITCSRQCQNYVHNVIHNVGAKRLQQYYEEHPENKGKWVKQWREDNPEEFKKVCVLGGANGGETTGKLQTKAAQICNGNIEPTSEDERIWAEKYMKIKKIDCAKAAKELTNRMWNANNPHYQEYEDMRNKALAALDNTKYERDINGNITHIDGIPIEEKYKLLRTNVLDITDSIIVSTGRNQNSTFWEGKEAFDQFLISQNIGWFVYIKFDIMNTPLVVGKTGTRLVSKGLNDIIFDYWESNHGPARQYLRDNNLDWNKTKVLIIPCETEQEALNKEKEIHDKYSLFYS